MNETLKSSTNGITGLQQQTDGQPNDFAGDDYGRLWARLFVNGAPVANNNPLPVVTAAGAAVAVVGLIAHDEPDVEATNFPVKTGIHANANPRANVGEDDIADMSGDLGGRLRTRVSSPGGDASTTNEALFVGGDEAHDAPDAGNPVKTGGRAAADATSGFAAVAANDRTDAAYDLSGRQLSLVEGTQLHDAAVTSTNGPVLGGGYGADTAPTLVSANGDLVRHWTDRAGRQAVLLDQNIAGENLPLNYLVTMRAKRMTEQDSWLVTPHDNVSSAVVKASPGRLARLQIINTSATGLYVIIHDNTNAAALVSVAFIRWRGWVNASAGGVPGVLDIGFEELDGIYFNIGVSWTTSTSVNSIAGATAVYGSSAYY